MSETNRFKLPLLASGQAQKHVTVNEAVSRIDALTHPLALSRSLSAPPEASDEGDLFVIGETAGGAWAGREGDIALFSNGGWDFVTPVAGMRAWVADEGIECVHDGAGWLDAVGGSRSGAATRLAVATLDHAIQPGASSVTAPAIPEKSIVIGVTARVLEPISGPGLTSWRVGVPDAPGRYGGGYGVGANAYADGLTSSPTAYFQPTPLLLEGEGGPFESGVVRLAVHFLALTPPRPI